MSFERYPGLVLHLAGPLRLLRRDGTEATPRLAKAQGILALLGASPALRRPRPWLQDKLWSDQPSENGSASLRQTIHRLRQAVGADHEWLVTMPGWVGLDPAHVSVVLEPAANEWDAAGDPPEFCEGLDISDPEFEDWIRDQRFAYEERHVDAPPAPVRPSSGAASPSQPPAMLLVARPQAGDASLQVLADLLAKEVASGVASFGGAGVLLEDRAGAAPPHPDALRLEVNACLAGDRALVQASLSHAESGTLIWSNNRTLATGRGASSSVLEPFVAEVRAAVSHELGRGGVGELGSAVRAGYRALREILSADSLSLAECDTILAATTQGPAATVHRAWRAQIRIASIIERLAADPAEAAKEAIEFVAESLREDPLNPIVNALAADVALHLEGSHMKAANLALTAVQRDCYSPFAHASLAQALTRLGKAAQAHAAALRALRLATGLPNQGWWNMRCCITAVRCGRYEEATRFAQTAHELSPSLKPPLRFLAALHFHKREERRAAGALQRLKELEPDFSLELMASDNYPVWSLRDGPLIEITRSELL